MATCRTVRASRRLAGWTVLLAIAASSGPGPAFAAPDNALATGTVLGIHRIASDAAEASPGKGAALVASAIRRYLATDILAAKTLGATYTTASANNKADFRAVLAEELATEIARKIKPGAQLSVTGTKPLGKTDVVVLTRVERDGGKPRRLDWKLRPCSTAPYCVFDLVLDGASLSAARATDYAARLKANGGSLPDLTRSLRGDLTRAK